jgi:alcohol dehydrogenase (cytochrome c)
VAVLGNRLYVGTLDAALISLDARTGLLMWETQVADSMEGYSITSAAAHRQRQSRYGHHRRGIRHRGFLQAFDAASGKPVWKFYTIPGPGESATTRGKGDSWQTGARRPG